MYLLNINACMCATRDMYSKVKTTQASINNETKLWDIHIIYCTAMKMNEPINYNKDKSYKQFRKRQDLFT